MISIIERAENTEYILALSYNPCSLACLEAIKQLGYPLDRIVHSEIWATKDIPAELPPILQFKKYADEFIKEKYGIEVEHVYVTKKGEKFTYEDQFYKQVKKGASAGQIYGFPYTFRSWCNNRLKIGSLYDIKNFTSHKKLLKKYNDTSKTKKNYIRYLGIAFDEEDRIPAYTRPEIILPLIEKKWTQNDCKNLCEKNNLMSPYATGEIKKGCWFCHNQHPDELRSLRKNYPELFNILLKWDADSPVSFKATGHTIQQFAKRFADEDAGVVTDDSDFFKWNYEKVSLTENKYTSEDLKIMQGWDLQRKIQVTQTRIIEWYTKYEGNVHVSFSGGKDSTVLLDLVRRVYPDVTAVFADTGLEFPEIKSFVKTIPNVVWLKPEMNFRKVIETYGYPLISKRVAAAIATARRSPNGKVAQRFIEGNDHDVKYNNKFSLLKYADLKNSDIPISAYCCSVMKKYPMKKYEDKTHSKPILGTMACESQMRKNSWLKTGCNAFDNIRPTSQPMSFWTEQDVLEYLKITGIDYAKVYGEILQDEKGKYYTTGASRTGCIFCGFGINLEKEPNRFQKLKKSHPKIWEYCMKPWDKGGLGMREVLNKIDINVD